MFVRQTIFLSLTAAVTAVATIPNSNSCRALPGDTAWPSTTEWSKFNETINGHLIATVPASSVCHDSIFGAYNATECSNLQTTWDDTALTHIGSPAEILNQYFQNYSCVPFTSQSQPCELGNYVSYIVNITGASDVQAAVTFAKNNNVRLVIKNTGHDYLGKSTGKGGLSLWTHNLKSTQYIPNYNSSYYNGPAAKLGAGVEAFEAYLLANSTGHRVVGGTCPTVGIAGGYSQGGGHSILSSSHGLGSDNVLEWEVVTMDGKHLIATPTQNSDLYWALAGGGGGTYGVVLSMTARLHQDSIVGGGLLTFNDSSVGNDKFWDAVGAFHALLPSFLDAGNSFTYGLGNKDLTAIGTMPGANLTEINTRVKPFLDDLTRRGIVYQFTPHLANTYYDHFYNYFGPAPLGAAEYFPFTDSRIVPRAMVTDPAKNKIVTQVLRNVSLIDGFSPFYCDSFNVAHQTHPDNSANPAWRDGIFLCSPGGSWDWNATREEMAERENIATNVLQPMLDAATPGGGVYLNEANYKQQNWQKEFYGSNYNKLLEIKNKYDPDSMLYARTAVGSEVWSEDGNGRLCRSGYSYI